MKELISFIVHVPYVLRLMRIHEHGLQNRENSKLYTKKPKCISGGGNFINVGLVDTRGAMLTYAYGFCLSLGLLFGEILLNKFNKQNKYGKCL